MIFIFILTLIALTVVVSIAVVDLHRASTQPEKTQILGGESDVFSQEFNQGSVFSANTSVTVNSTTTLLLATSSTGLVKYARFTNLGTSTVFLSFGSAPLYNTGIPLFASSSYEIRPDVNPFVTAVYALVSTTPATVSVLQKN